MPVTLTGTPFNSVGGNRAPFAARSADDRNNGWPLTALAETTLPLSSIKTSTLTEPLARTAFAAGGISGIGKLIAFPLSSPPETVFGTGGGASGVNPRSRSKHLSWFISSMDWDCEKSSCKEDLNVWTRIVSIGLVCSVSNNSSLRKNPPK